MIVKNRVKHTFGHQTWSCFVKGKSRSTLPMLSVSTNHMAVLIWSSGVQIFVFLFLIISWTHSYPIPHVFNTSQMHSMIHKVNARFGVVSNSVPENSRFWWCFGFFLPTNHVHLISVLLKMRENMTVAIGDTRPPPLSTNGSLKS